MNRWFRQFIDSVGDGSGTTNLIGDYSGAATTFKIQPASNDTLQLHRMIVAIEDNGTFDDDHYGAITSSLTNGLELRVADDDGEIFPVSSAGNIKTNADWQSQCYDVALNSFEGGGNNKVMAMRWTFAKAGKPLELRGDLNQRLELILEDDLTGLVRHTFLVQGFYCDEHY